MLQQTVAAEEVHFRQKNMNFPLRPEGFRFRTDFSARKPWYRMEENKCDCGLQNNLEEQFDDKAVSWRFQEQAPDVSIKMYIKPYDILGYANKGVFLLLEDYIEKHAKSEEGVDSRSGSVSAPSHLRTGIYTYTAVC